MKAITTTLKVLSLITGLAAYADVIPAKFMPVAALVFASASTVKDLLTKVGDYLDNKQMDGSFKP
jgi:hypothetical protein